MKLRHSGCEPGALLTLKSPPFSGLSHREYLSVTGMQGTALTQGANASSGLCNGNTHFSLEHSTGCSLQVFRAIWIRGLLEFIEDAVMGLPVCLLS